MWFRRRSKKSLQTKSRSTVARRAGRSQIEALEDRRVLATITVDTTVDDVANDSVTSLREAIESINSGADTSDVTATGAYGVDDRIEFNLPGAGPHTIALANGELSVTNALTTSVRIIGPGATQLTIDAQQSSRIFSFNVGSATISDITLTGGSDTDGGAIFNERGLTIINTVVQNNTASGDGGGIYNSGSLVIEDSTISGNSAAGSGGGIFTDDNLILARTAMTLGVNSPDTIAGTGDVISSPDGTVTFETGTLSTYSGATILTSGTTFVNGILDTPGDLVTVQNGATLAGTGEIRRGLRVESGAIVAPGTGPSILEVGTTNFLGGSMFNVEVNGVATAGVDYDQLKVTGSVIIDTEAELVISGTVTGAMPGDTITLIDNNGSDTTNDNFKDKPDGSTVTVNGEDFRIFYNGGDGNDVVLVKVVEDLTVHNNLDDTLANLAGDGELSLREAIELANNPGTIIDGYTSPNDLVDVIDFDPLLANSTITLNAGQNLQLTESVTIQGLGADQLTINGNGGPIFGLDGANTDKTFTINDLTLTGAVNTVNMSGSNLNDVLNINRVVARGNADSDSAGSVMVASFGTVNVTDTAIVNNAHNGHAFDLSSASATFTNVTISGNDGNAISIFPGSNLTNSLSLLNVTIADNDGAGVQVRNFSSATTTLTLDYQNSILADNAGGNFEVGTVGGTLTITSLGSNILDDTPSGDAAHTAGSFDQRNTDPMIGPLEENMGTFVHPLLIGSPAIDFADDLAAPAADQRGVARNDGNNNGNVTADVGAYEFVAFSYNIGGVDDVTLLYDSGSDEVRVVETGDPGNILAFRDKDEIDIVLIDGDDDDNSLTVDSSFFELSLDIEYEGGDQANSPNGDILVVQGSGSEDAVYTPDASIDRNGTVVVTNGASTSTITFTGLEPVDITGFATATLMMPAGGANDTLSVDEGFDFATNAIPALVVSGTTGDSTVGAMDGTTIETAAFWNNGTVIIDTTGTDGDDTITVTGGDNLHGNDSFTIDTGTGTDTVTFSGDFETDAAGNVTVDSVTINVNADIDTTGAGAIDLEATRNISISAAATLTTVDGDITLLANAGGTETGTFDGIELVGDITSTNGDISLTGTGGDTGTSHGVELTGGATITSTGTGTDAATITIIGTVTNTNNTSDGVSITSGSVITSEDGDISITGTSSGDDGVVITSGADVISTGTGTDAATITINGTSTGSGNADGIEFLSALITSVDGDISITGNSDDDDGVRIISSTVSSTGTGADAAEIFINGIGNTASSYFGLEINGINTLITSVDGDILLEGSSAAARPATNILLGATVSSTGMGTDAATITIQGTSTGAGAFADGVEISGVDAGMPTTVTSIDGDILIEGQSTSADGVAIASSAVVESTGTGTDAATITIEGTSTGNGDGVVIDGMDTVIRSVIGDIMVTGTTATDDGVQMSNMSSILSDDGNITIVGEGDVLLTTVDADNDDDGSVATVSVTANPDSNTNPSAIIDNLLAAETPNISANMIVLQAGDGIGNVEMSDASTDDEDIDVQVLNLAATTISGDISITDTDDALIATDDGLNLTTVGTIIGVTITGAANVGDPDDILIRKSGQASSEFDVSQAVSIDAGGTGHITLINYDETTLDIDAPITNNGTGNVELFSGGNVDLGAAGDITTAGGDIEIHAGTTTNYFVPVVLTTDTDEYDVIMDTGAVVASNDGNILLTATASVELATVNAGTGNVYVIADNDNGGGGMITDGLDTEDANITAMAASLRAGDGIGGVDMANAATDDDDIDTSVIDLAATTIEGDISISNEITSADFNITAVAGMAFRKFGTPTTVTGVTITDGLAADDILIRSNQSGADTTEFNVLEVVSISGGSAEGHITLINYDETLLDIDAPITNNGTGNVELFSGGNVDLAAAGDITTSGGDIEIHAGTTTNYFVAVVLTTDTDEHNVIMDTDAVVASGDGNILLTATGDVELSTINAGTGNVYVIADLDTFLTIDTDGEGEITDGLDSEDANIVATAASLRAGDGIGAVDMTVAATDDQDIDTEITDLAAITGTGDISISDDGSLDIDEVLGATFRKFGMVGDLSGVTISTGGADDDILIRNGSAGTTDFDIFRDVTNNGTGDVTLVQLDDSDMDVEANVTGSGGDVQLISADDVDLNDADFDASAITVSTTGTGNVEILAAEMFNFGTTTTFSGDTDGDVFMDADATVSTEDGNMVLVGSDDVQLATLDANSDNDGTLGTVFVIADSDATGVGGISDVTPTEDANVTALAVSLSAGSGVGDGAVSGYVPGVSDGTIDVTDIDLETSTIAARTDSGDIALENGDLALEIGTIAGLAFSKFGTPATIMGLTIDDTIVSDDSGDDDITVVNGLATITANNDVINNDGGDIRLRTDDDAFGSTEDIAFGAGVTIESSPATGSSEIFLEAGDSMTVPDSVTVQAGNEVTFETDFNNFGLNDSAGGFLSIEGGTQNVGGNAGPITINLFSNEDDDTARVDYTRLRAIDGLNIDSRGNSGATTTVVTGGEVFNSTTNVVQDGVTPGLEYNQQSELDPDTISTLVEVGDTVRLNDAGQANSTNYRLTDEILDRSEGTNATHAGVEYFEFTGSEGSNVFTADGSQPLAMDLPRLQYSGGSMDDHIVIAGTDGDDFITIGDILEDYPITVEGIECVQVMGGDGNDVILNNTSFKSIIDGGNGNDILVGGEGPDAIFGGAGVDALFGRGGNDFLFSDEDLLGNEFNDDGDLLHGGLGIDSGDQQGVDQVKQIEILEDGGAEKSVLFWLRGIIGDVDREDAFEAVCFPALTVQNAIPAFDPGGTTDLGVIDMDMQTVDLTAVGGFELFTFTPMHQPGFLTIEADYLPANGTIMELFLFDQNGTVVVDDMGEPVGYSSDYDGNERIDFKILDTGVTYTVGLLGDNTDVKLTITNALTQNSPLTIHGTEGDDVVAITTGPSSMQIVYNGVPYEFANDSTESVTFLGNGGHDTFTVDGISSTQFAVHGPGSTTLTGSPTVIHTAGVEQIDYLLNGALRSYLSSEVETYDWQNQQNPMDVDASGVVTLNDALLIVSEIRRGGVRNISVQDPGAAPTYFDTNGDGLLTLADAMLVIAEMRTLAGIGDGEATSSEGESDTGALAGSSPTSDGEASGADAYAALLAEQSSDDDDSDSVLDATIDSIADDIAAGLIN